MGFYRTGGFWTQVASPFPAHEPNPTPTCSLQPVRVSGGPHTLTLQIRKSSSHIWNTLARPLSDCPLDPPGSPLVEVSIQVQSRHVTYFKPHPNVVGNNEQQIRTQIQHCLTPNQVFRGQRRQRHLWSGPRNILSRHAKG